MRSACKAWKGSSQVLSCMSENHRYNASGWIWFEASVMASKFSDGFKFVLSSWTRRPTYGNQRVGFSAAPPPFPYWG